jgi:hypothetical protein
MTEIVFEGNGRAVIHHTGTGQEMTCSVPTALENIANSRGVWAHGYKPAGLQAKAAPVVAPEPVIALVDPDHLPLPLPEPEPDPVSESAIADRLRPVSDEHVHVPTVADPLDHDGDGKKGGARKPADPERSALFAALEARGIKAFKGASNDKLKALLAG